MKLTPTQPVTIDSVRYGERWFPFVFRSREGMLVMYISYGHDAHFCPAMRLESHDNGKTWTNPTDNVPRVSWAHWFEDSQLFEIDTYGVHDPKTASTTATYGAWSWPLRIGAPVERGHVLQEAPSGKMLPLNALQGYPTFPWWDLWNGLHDNQVTTGEQVHIGGMNFTTGIELADGRLLALGYWMHSDPAVGKDATHVMESADRGYTWREVGTVTDLAAEAVGTNEAAIAELADGRLYAVLRATAGPLVHAWSSDQGRTWTPPTVMKLIDEEHQPAHVWPVMHQMADGTLVLVYGRPGKHLVIDPSGTGEQWQHRLDLHQLELDTQAAHGVPEDQRLRGVVGYDINVYCNRHTDSSDYLAVVSDGADGLLVFYDVQHYIEHWNAPPVSAVRMVHVDVQR